MKRFFVCLFCFLFACTPALAEIVGSTGTDDFICRYTAPNGQQLYYVSTLDTEYVKMEDVNFDGVEDIVIVTAIGASNSRFEFFVWDGSQYVLADHSMDAMSLYNYELYPEEGLLVSHLNNGYAGALHHTAVFRWQGTKLVLLRYADGVEKTTWEFTDNAYITTVDYNTITMTVHQVNLTDTREDVLLWQKDLTTQELDTTAVFDEQRSILFDNLPR